MENIIEVKNLVKEYKGGVLAVNDISFCVKKGELFAFLGENGAGKSTTINILCTVLTKTSGNVIINGFDIDKNPEGIRNSIGIVFQGSVLDDMLSVMQNLEARCSFYGLTREEKRERIEYLVNLLDLKEILKRKYGTLSGGQRRRVDIARALINNPDILFLDEPTTGLDPKTRKMVWQIIDDLRIKTGLTVFLTTHYMEEVKDASYVVILDHGRIVAHDTPNGLKANHSSNRLFWHTEESTSNNELLDKYSFEYHYDFDTYCIKANDMDECVKFLYQEKIKDFEIIKGNMDDVFLNVTGKVLGD